MKIGAKRRAALPGHVFAGPNRSFPIPDRNHAKAALSMVGRSVAAGHISAEQAEHIRARARAKLGKK